MIERRESFMYKEYNKQLEINYMPNNRIILNNLWYTIFSHWWLQLQRLHSIENGYKVIVCDKRRTQNSHGLLGINKHKVIKENRSRKVYCIFVVEIKIFFLIMALILSVNI